MAEKIELGWPYDVEVSIAGGDVTDVAIDGESQGRTSGSFELKKGQVLTVTYTNPPKISSWRRQ